MQIAKIAVEAATYAIDKPKRDCSSYTSRDRYNFFFRSSKRMTTA